MATPLNVFAGRQENSKPENGGFDGFMQSFGNVISNVASTISSGLKHIFEITGLKKLSQGIMAAFGFMKQDNLASKAPIPDAPNSPSVMDMVKTASAFTPFGGLVKGGEALLNAGKALIADKEPAIAPNDMEAKLRNIVATSAPPQEPPQDTGKGMKF